MKRTAATLALLAGFGGGCASTDSTAKKAATPVGGFNTVSEGKQVPGVVGPYGEPIMAARGATPGGVAQAGGFASGAGSGSGIQQAGVFNSGDCPTCAHVPGTAGMPAWNGEVMSKFYAAANGYVSSPPGAGPAPTGFDNRGIMPVPSMGPPGAVAAVGALPLAGTRAAVLGRTSVRFTGPAGMKVTWQLPNGLFNDESSGLTAPKEYNFLQGQTYRLRLTQILPNFPGRSFYPTLEVAAGNPKSITYLAHNAVPLTFTNEDFEQARAGNLVVKVIYLPDRDNQDFAMLGGADELVSTRLEPGADPVVEAQRKGTILAVVRLGNIDLENRISPSMVAPPPAMMAPQPPRSGPIMLPPPPQTLPPAPPVHVPGVGSSLTPPPKPIASLSSIPMNSPGSGSGTDSGSAKGPGSGSSNALPAPSVPSVPKATSSDANGSGSGLPSILPPINSFGPGSGK